nr:hypothetical protein [Paracoccus mutanolyticus]
MLDAADRRFGLGLDIEQADMPTTPGEPEQETTQHPRPSRGVSRADAAGVSGQCQLADALGARFRDPKDPGG